jgi:hypothetical protein
MMSISWSGWRLSCGSLSDVVSFQGLLYRSFHNPIAFVTHSFWLDFQESARANVQKRLTLQSSLPTNF